MRLRHALPFGLAAACVLLACQTAGLQKAYMALDSEGNRQRTTFYTDSTSVYCIANLVSARADVTLEAQIHSVTQYDAASGQNVPYVILYTDAEEAPGMTTLTVEPFLMSKVPPALAATSTSSQDALPYPVGDYACDLLLDGSLYQSVPFSIVFPACPAVPVTTTLPCAGWVKPGSVCPGVTPGQMCTCSASSSQWVCSP